MAGPLQPDPSRAAGTLPRLRGALAARLRALLGRLAGTPTPVQPAPVAERIGAELYSHFPDAVLLLRDGRIIDLNPAAARLLELSTPAQALGTPLGGWLLSDEHADDIVPAEPPSAAAVVRPMAAGDETWETGVVAAHYYSGRVVPCDFPDCDGRAVCCVRNSAGRYRDVCASCRHWHCAQSTPVPVAGIAAWLAESQARVQAWCNLPTP